MYLIGSPACVWMFRFRVLDLVDDAELFLREYEASRDPATGLPDFAAFWAENAREVLDALARRGVARQPSFTLLPPRFVAGGREYLAEVAFDVAKREETFFEAPAPTVVDGIVRGELRISAPGLGGKRVTSLAGDPYPRYAAAAVLGTFLSPYEKRAAIVLGLSGFDGDGGRQCACRIFGAHLAVGFSRALGPLSAAAPAKARTAAAASSPVPAKSAATASAAATAAKSAAPVKPASDAAVKPPAPSPAKPAATASGAAATARSAAISPATPASDAAAAAKAAAPSPAKPASTAMSAAPPITKPPAAPSDPAPLSDAEFNALGLAAQRAAMGPRFAEELWFAAIDSSRPEAARRSLRFAVEDGVWTVAVGAGGRAAATYVIVGVEREGRTYRFATASREFSAELPALDAASATFRGMVSGAYEVAR